MGLKSRAAIFFGSKAAEEQLSTSGISGVRRVGFGKGQRSSMERILPFEKVVFSKRLFQSVCKYFQRKVNVVISASVQH